MIYLIHNFGIIIFLLILFLIFKTLKGALKKVCLEKNKLFSFLFLYLSYLCALELISLPIGNLLVSSTPNVLLLIIITILYLFRHVKKNPNQV